MFSEFAPIDIEKQQITMNPKENKLKKRTQKPLTSMELKRRMYKLNRMLCQLKYISVYRELKEHSELYKSFKLPSLEQDNFCGKMQVLGPCPLEGLYHIDKVSVSIPSDAMGNRIDRDGCCMDKLPETIEILLFGKFKPFIKDTNVIPYDITKFADVRSGKNPINVEDMVYVYKFDDKYGTKKEKNMEAIEFVHNYNTLNETLDNLEDRVSHAKYNAKRSDTPYVEDKKLKQEIELALSNVKSTDWDKLQEMKERIKCLDLAVVKQINKGASYDCLYVKKDISNYSHPMVSDVYRYDSVPEMIEHLDKLYKYQDSINLNVLFTIGDNMYSELVEIPKDTTPEQFHTIIRRDIRLNVPYNRHTDKLYYGKEQLQFNSTDDLKHGYSLVLVQ